MATQILPGKFILNQFIYDKLISSNYVLANKLNENIDK